MSSISARIRVIAMVSAVVIANGVLATTSSYATKSDKVVICHATNAHSNPYARNNVNTSSVDEKNNKFLNGHGDHEGGVWYKGIADHSWGDIIPPFESPKGTSFKGQNWNEAGKTIYNNGCKIKVTEDKPVKDTNVTPSVVKDDTKPTTPVDNGKGNTSNPVKPEVKVDTPSVPAANQGKGSAVPAAAVELPQTGTASVFGVVGTLGAITYAVVRRFTK